MKELIGSLIASVQFHSLLLQTVAFWIVLVLVVVFTLVLSGP